MRSFKSCVVAEAFSILLAELSGTLFFCTSCHSTGTSSHHFDPFWSENNTCLLRIWDAKAVFSCKSQHHLCRANGEVVDCDVVHAYISASNLVWLDGRGGARKLRFIWLGNMMGFDMVRTDCRELSTHLAGFEPVTICRSKMPRCEKSLCWTQSCPLPCWSKSKLQLATAT